MRTIKTNKMYKEDFEMLQRITDKSKTREFLKSIYYDGEGHLVSTDGKKMYVCDVTNWYGFKDTLGTEKGKFIYEKDYLIEVQETLHFPEYKRVLRDIDTYQHHISIPDVGKSACKTNNRGIQRLLDLSMITGYRFSADLAEVMKYMEGTWDCYFDDSKDNMMTLKNGDNRTLVIMPMTKYWE